MNSYDVIVIGGGSVGVPITYFLAKAGVKVLCLDKRASVGQGDSKAAIGGVRATHSEPAKIKLCQKSLDIFSNWEKETGVDIGWKKGGYCFPVYRKKEENILKKLLPVQHSYNLDIQWVSAEKIVELIPGINAVNLRGGTYSPGDGQVSPLKAISSFASEATKFGANFEFHSKVIALHKDKSRITCVETERDKYYSALVVNASGADAREVSKLAGIDMPVFPDSHEAGISAPIAPFLKPLVVDMRPGNEGKTENFYFGQNSDNQIIFCYTPKPIFSGKNRYPTSEFMPVLAKRLSELVPKFKNLLIRRIWRGLYPMTPDGTPIIGKFEQIENLHLAIGMCGQGFMMGPGVGANVANLIVDKAPLFEQNIFELLSPSRDFYAKKELLK